MSDQPDRSGTPSQPTQPQQPASPEPGSPAAGGLKREVLKTDPAPAAGSGPARLAAARSTPSPERPRRGFWSRFLPASRTRRLIGFAAMLAVLAYGGFIGSLQRTGWGTGVDTAIGLGVTLGIILIAPLAAWIAMHLGRLLPRYFGYLGLGGFLAFTFLLSNSGFSLEQGAIVAGAGVVLLALAIGSLAVLTSGRFGRMGLLRKGAVLLTGLVGVAGLAVATLWTADSRWLTEESSLAHLVDVRAVHAAETMPAPMDAPNPSRPGTHDWEYLTYGSGNDIRRPEFGEDADLVTASVNGKPFTDIPKGWKGDMRREFWGFDMDAMPIQGRVWYPVGDGPFPLVLIVHGNHNMAEYSDPGYAYLGELMASRGFIFTSVDENFLNGASGRWFAGARAENDARGWLLLEHLKVWRQWSQAGDNPFTGKVDMDNIALIGHSRGGEAVQHAAVFNRLQHYPNDASVEFDYGFDIKSIVAIAPVDTQYRPADHDAVMEDVNFFSIHGSHDADVTRFSGDRMFRRLRFSEPGDFFKATLYVYRANHGQFNTVWGPTDTGAPRAWFLNRAALLDGEAQRAVAKLYISAFLEATLRGRREYVDMFRDHRKVRNWLPDILLVSRYEDPSFRLVTDFEEDVDVTTTTIDGGAIATGGLVVWREGDVKFRGNSNRGDHGVYLGWNVEEQAAGLAEVTEAAAGTPEAEGDPTAAAAGTGTPPATPESPPVEPASYSITLPDGLAQQWQLGPDSLLVLNVAQSTDSPKPKDYSPREPDEQGQDEQAQDPDTPGQEQQQGTGSGEPEGDESDEDEADEEEPTEPLDLTVELVTGRGVAARLPLSRFGTIAPPLKAQVMRETFVGPSASVSSEPTLQTFEIPLSAFIAAESTFVPVDLRAINLVFDRGDKGVVIVDRIGFAGR